MLENNSNINRERGLSQSTGHQLTGYTEAMQLTDLERFTALLRKLNTFPVNLQDPIETTSFAPEWQPALTELNRFRKLVADSLVTLDRTLGTMGTKEALQVLQLHRLIAILDDQHADLQRLSTNVEELSQGVTRVAEDVHATAGATNQMAQTSDQTLGRLHGVLDSFQGLDQHAVAARETVDSLVEHSRRAGAGLRDIRAVASTSQLLALNAAIQAAHASDKAFAVVAQEMRQLSDKTTNLVKQIEGQVAAMESAATSALSSVRTLSETALEAGTESRQVLQGLDEMRDLIRQTSGSVQSIAAVAEEQAAGTEALADAGRSLLAQVGAASESLNLTRNMQISDVAEHAQVTLGQFRIGSHTDKMRAVLNEMADRVEATFEQLVADRTVSLDALFDTNYQELKGRDVRHLARLFNVDRVPEHGFTPTKYRTGYDHLVDEPLNKIADHYFTQWKLDFCTILDLNGFALAQPRALTKDWTGIPELDLRGNRTRRVLTDPLSRKSCRIGLPAELQNKANINRDDMMRAGLFAQQRPEVRPFLLQTYALDTGVVVLAMAMPVYVQGRRWGVVRIGYQAS